MEISVVLLAQTGVLIRISAHLRIHMIQHHILSTRSIWYDRRLPFVCCTCGDSEHDFLGSKSDTNTMGEVDAHIHKYIWYGMLPYTRQPQREILSRYISYNRTSQGRYRDRSCAMFCGSTWVLRSQSVFLGCFGLEGLMRVSTAVSKQLPSAPTSRPKIRASFVLRLLPTFVVLYWNGIDYLD